MYVCMYVCIYIHKDDFILTDKAINQNGSLTS